MNWFFWDILRPVDNINLKHIFLTNIPSHGSLKVPRAPLYVNCDRMCIVPVLMSSFMLLALASAEVGKRGTLFFNLLVNQNSMFFDFFKEKSVFLVFLGK